MSALEEHRRDLAQTKELVRRNDYDTENKLFWRKKRYGKIAAVKKNEINTLNSKMEFDKLRYQFKIDNRTSINFSTLNCPLRKIKDGSINLEKEKGNQKKYRSNLSEVIRGEWEQKSEVHKKTINNMFCNAMEKVTNFFYY